MAEALAIVGVVASVAQLVDFSTTVLYRLKEYQSSLGEVPKSFRQISKELPLLLHTIQQIQDAIDAGFVGIETEKALLPVVEGCQEQLELLESILVKTLPKADDSSLEKGKKAISSLGQDGKVERILKNLRDEKLIKIRQWLSPPDPSVNHQKWCKQRQEDTGLWFLNSEEYGKWKTDTASIIWLHGIPGCGKTILSSTIIEDVVRHCISDPGKVVAYFYFDFKDVQKQSTELMVRSLICQLSEKCVQIPASLELLFSSCNNGQRYPSLDSQLDALQQMIQEYPQCYIILDALDECKNRAELMDILSQITSWQLDKLHVLVTSRKERDIETSLESLVQGQNIICLESGLVDGDIQKYVRQRLLDDASLKKWQKYSDVQHEIETALTGGPRGMFRWAVCQLDALGKCRNLSQLRHALTTLPQTLDATYDQILCAINEEDSEYAARILRWLAFSSRPLMVEEISEVVAIDTTRDPMFNQEEVLEDPLDVLDICSSLITITTIDSGSEGEKPFLNTRFTFWPSGKMVELAHYSVKEYLISTRSRQNRPEKYSIQEISCNEFLAKSCLGYLLRFDKCDLLDLYDIEGCCLATYAAEWWTTHAQEAGQTGGELSHQIMSFFTNKTGAYLNWVKLLDADDPWELPDFTRTLEDVATPLYFASLYDMTDIVEQLLAAGADVNAQGELFGNALQAASLGGYTKTIKVLLNAGADFDAQGGRFGTALQAASVQGHNNAVEMLLSKGANVNAQGGDYGNALGAASYYGHDKTVRVLLSKGADVDAQCGEEYGNALLAASLGGHNKVVELLLSKGVNVNAQGGRYNNALQAASAGHHSEIIEMLLIKGANVNAQGGYYGNALQAASYSGHNKIIEVLLSKGADVNAQGGVFSNAVQAASYHGFNKTVMMLLSNGADVNAQGGEYGNALQTASIGGHNKVVELLLSKGVDINAQGGHYNNSALQAASGEGHNDTVELLLSKGADVNAQGGRYGNALQAASYSGYNKIIELLLSKGADINAQGGRYDNALQTASERGHNDTVELLLRNGAKRNCKVLETGRNEHQEEWRLQV
ncbi:hypothetical protein V498_03651 [Pseudogymnoascus sp. VKM F-4517 (FW-2822)]|nr:hypothetical protein V498_03651 [Pseudogymnoascus sp. VKM F-4517 (FW-2822)]